MFSGLDVIGENPARRWTALVSFALQAAAAATALAYSLLYPQSLPRFMRPIFVPVSSADIPAPASHGQSRTGPATTRHPLVVSKRRFSFQQSNNQASDIGLTTPPDIPDSASPQGVFNSTPSEDVRPVLHASTTTHLARQSVVMEGNLIYRVEPRYPPVAQQIRLQGTVVLKAIISRRGSIEQAVAVSGPALLAPAALEAVKQWKYHPYYLNGEPVDVETQVTVNFVLDR